GWGKFLRYRGLFRDGRAKMFKLHRVVPFSPRRVLCVLDPWRYPMTVQDVMTRKVVTIGADDSVSRARARMSAAGVHQLVVRDRRGWVVGVLSTGDIRRVPDGGAVSDFMCRRLLIV